MANATNGVRKHVGSCHCGAVKFEALVDAAAGSACNCTVCTKTAMLGTIVRPDAFTLLAGERNLTAYEWGHKTAKRYFCTSCRIAGSSDIEITSAPDGARASPSGWLRSARDTEPSRTACTPRCPARVETARVGT